MQTFLPYTKFDQCAKVLDNKRLGKQRVECKQIFRAMYRGGAWKNHPATRMWRGHGWYLIIYYEFIVREWKNRGFKHEMTLDEDCIEKAHEETQRPRWLGISAFHAMHQVLLYVKDPCFYATFEPSYGTPVLDARYLWPVDQHGHLTALYQQLTAPPIRVDWGGV